MALINKKIFDLLYKNEKGKDIIEKSPKYNSKELKSEIDKYLKENEIEEEYDDEEEIEEIEEETSYSEIINLLELLINQTEGSVKETLYKILHKIKTIEGNIDEK